VNADRSIPFPPEPERRPISATANADLAGFGNIKFSIKDDQDNYFTSSAFSSANEVYLDTRAYAGMAGTQVYTMTFVPDEIDIEAFVVAMHENCSARGLLRNVEPGPSRLRITLPYAQLRQWLIENEFQNIFDTLAQHLKSTEWLDEGDQHRLTPEIRASSVEWQICPNWRSYKKMVPALLEAPGAYIVTADDDVYYPADWLEKLVAHACAGVVCHRGKN